MLGDGKWLRFRSESFGRLAGQGKVDVELADSCGGEGGEASYVYRVKVTIMTRSVVEKKVGSVPGRGRWWQGGGGYFGRVISPFRWGRRSNRARRTSADCTADGAQPTTTW